MKTTSKLTSLLFVAALVAAPFVQAADPAPSAPAAPEGARPRPAMKRAMEHRMQMLTEKLKLTAEQQERIKAIWKQAGGEGRAMRDDAVQDRAEQRAKAQELRKATREQVRGVLTPEQQAIFDQMPAEGPARPGGKPAKEKAN